MIKETCVKKRMRRQQSDPNRFTTCTGRMDLSIGLAASGLILREENDCGKPLDPPAEIPLDPPADDFLNPPLDAVPVDSSTRRLGLDPGPDGN